MVPAPLHTSVRGRLALFVCAVALPTVLLASALVYLAYANERATVSEKLANNSHAAAQVIDGQIEAALATLSALAATSEVREGSPGPIDEIARQVLAGDPRWFSLTDLDGQQRVNTGAMPGSTLPRVELPADLRTAMTRGESYISDLQRSAVIEAMIVRVSRPWIREGQVAGVLSLSIPATAVARSIPVEEFHPGGVISIVDRTGRIIARNKGSDRYVGQMATPDMVAAVTAGREGVQHSVTLEGIPVLTAIGRAKCGWSVLIGAPETALYAAPQALLRWGVVGVALLVGLMGAMAWWIGRAVVQGVEVLCRDAELIGRGEVPAEPAGGLQELDFVGGALRRSASVTRQRTRTLEILNRVNATLLAERDLQKIVQSVTDAGREASGAAFGAFFYNVENAAGESYMLYTLSGAPREAFEKFGMPRNTPVFRPTFAGEGVVRVADIRADPRYGKVGPHHGMPQGHLPVRSYLAVPVKSRDGTVIGGLFYGHPEPGRFTAEAEEIVVGLSAEAAIAIDHAKLYRTLELELAAKSKAERELRDAQARLQQHAHDLERMVEQRTTSLQAAVEQMEEFSYTISHDLRSPLRSMHSFGTLLLEEYGEKLDQTAIDYLRRIVRASDRMHRMTSDLLQYSKVARTEVKLSSTNVTAVVQANIDHYPELKPPTIVTVVHPLANVMAYEPSLTQCVGNLMTNAAKFVRPGRQPHLTIRTERRGDRVRIWFEDNGIGIPALGQKQLFQVFQRLPNDVPYEGTGMGLAIVRKAVEKMGGTCGVESDGVSGSRFWVELAAAREETDATEVPVTVEPKEVSLPAR